MRIVSGFFRIPNKYDTFLRGSDKSKQFYNENLMRFFKYLRTQPITFFTDVETYPYIQALAGPNVDIQLRNFDYFPIFNDIPVEEWKYHMEMDSMKFHTWELGVIWASKGYFLKETIEMYPNEEWFVWVDAGCIRTDDWEPFMDDFTYREFGFNKPGVYFESLNELPKEPMLFDYHPTLNYLAGTFILMHKDFIEKYLQEYLRIFKKYTEAKKPAICDQFVIATMGQENDWIYPVEQRIKAVPDMWMFFFAVL